MTTTPSAPLSAADLDDYGVNHYEDEHGECYWCCDEWPCFTHRLLSMARDALALRKAIIEWHVADKKLIDELCTSDDPGGPSGPTVNAQMDAEDVLHDIAETLLAAGRATAGTT